MRKIKLILKRLGSLPLKIIVKKVFNYLSNELNCIYGKTKRKIKPIRVYDVRFADFKPQCSFLFNPDNKQFYIDEMVNENINCEIVIDADKICGHLFELLGSGEINLDKIILWNKDYKSNYIWKNDFYEKIHLVDYSNDSDVKIPWELSRFQHIFTLGKAYWITVDEKYVSEFKEQISDWIVKNPVEMSINWTCSMEVAIRAINWISGYFFFKDALAKDKNFLVKFNTMLYLHGKFIFKNLENKGEITGNHYLSDIAGLIWIGIYFKNFDINDKEKDNNPNKWVRFGLSEFEREMSVQVNNDGTDYEASTSYHRLVTEIFLLTAIFCKKNYIELSRTFICKLERMCEFIMHITKPNGLAPLFGDSDDGRILILSKYFTRTKRDFRHLLNIAGEFFNRDDFRYFGINHREDSLWTIGEFRYDINWNQNLRSKAFSQGGYYILRNERIYCLIRCGELSCRGQGGHSHNDQLSFELVIDEEDIIIDPGVYVYTADFKMRNMFRSTSNHNTININGYEQNEFHEYNLFEMRERSYGECVEFDENLFRGRHYGYYDKVGAVHERKIHITDNGIILSDNIFCDKNTNKAANFILHYKVEIKCEGNKIVLSKNSLVIEMHIPINSEYIIRKGYMSQEYGQLIPTNIIEVRFTNNDLQVYLDIK